MFQFFKGFLSWPCSCFPVGNLTCLSLVKSLEIFSSRICLLVFIAIFACSFVAVAVIGYFEESLFAVFEYSPLVFVVIHLRKPSFILFSGHIQCSISYLRCKTLSYALTSAFLCFDLFVPSFMLWSIVIYIYIGPKIRLRYGYVKCT